MALTSVGTFINLALVDAAGNKSGMRIELTYADLAALSTGVTAGDITGLLTDLNAVTDALIVSYSVGEKFEEDTALYGAAGSEVEAKASISAKVAGQPTKRVTLYMPAPTDGIFLGATGEDRNIVDTTDAAIQAWLDNYYAAGANLLKTSDGEQIDNPATAGTFKGKRIHRGSRKG